MFAAEKKHLRAERFDERMIGFECGALIEFGERFIVKPLIEKNARAVIARDHALRRIQSRHALEAPQSLLVITVEPGHDATCEVNTRIVRGFASQLLGHLAGALLFATRQ